MKLLAILLMFVSLTQPSTFSGVWTGAFRGGDSDVPQLMNLKQQGTVITGSGGPDSTEQFPITHGSVSHDEVKFELENGKNKFFYRLKSTDKGLQGTLTINGANSTDTTTVWLERAR